MKARSPVSPLNKALYERLKSQMPVAVFDYVPGGKKTPYTVLTDTDARPWSSKTIAGADVTATIEIYSEYQGDKEVAELADKAIAAITESPLVLADSWRIVRSSIGQHTVERFDNARKATIQFTFIIIDVKE